MFEPAKPKADTIAIELQQWAHPPTLRSQSRQVSADEARGHPPPG